MKKLSRLLVGLFLILVFMTTIIFAYFNPTPVTLQFGSRSLPPLPVSALLITAFIIGGVLGLLFGLRLFSRLRTRLELNTLRKKLRQTEQAAEQSKRGAP
ncbi:MAG: lipopolysaccharide assembly protein LapA domain-containing protein [Pseudohongiellaceae bacterium]